MQGVLKSIPVWLRIIIAFSILGAGSLALSEESEQLQASESAIAQPEQKHVLTESELTEFDNAIVEFDPDKRLITSVTQWKDSVLVNVSVTQEFTELTRAEKGEIATTLRNELATVCECSPYLYFNTESGQHIVEIGLGRPKHKL